MIDALPQQVWIRPGTRAAYPSLEAAVKGLQASPPEPDSVYLRSYPVDSETASHLQGVLTNEQGQIPRSLPKRALDALCGVGSLTGAVAAGAGALLSAGSLVGIFVFAPALLELTGELGGQGMTQLSRAIQGHSALATESNRSAADAYFDGKEPKDTVKIDRYGEEWRLSS